MENKKDTISIAPSKRSLKRAPKLPCRKLPNGVSETNDDIIDKQQFLSKIHSAESHSGFGRGIFKNDKKVAPTQVAFGYGDSSKARSFGIPRSSIGGDEHEEGSYVPATEVEKKYVEPWEDMVEEPPMFSFELPANLPLLKRLFEAVASKKLKETKKGSRLEDLPAGFMGKLLEFRRLEDLPAGFMGKLLEYRSGAVKMMLGDVLVDVSPGVDCMFAQDVEEPKKCATDVDSLMSSLDDMDV